jgi:hypothetical protein
MLKLSIIVEDNLKEGATEKQVMHYLTHMWNLKKLISWKLEVTKGWWVGECIKLQLEVRISFAQYGSYT